MSDYTAEPHVTLIFGKGKSGKTSAAYKALLNADDAVAVFLYDKSGQAQRRLGLRPAGTAAECEAALASRVVCFNPHRMFPGAKLARAFPWFLGWILAGGDTFPSDFVPVCKRGPGRKILFVDELWDECTPHSVPDELLTVIKCGRFEGLEFIGVTHRPREFPIALRSQVTEWICFHTSESAELDVVGEYCPRPERIAMLATKGQFLAFNRETGGELFGGFCDRPGGWGEFKQPW